eukprot:gnl/TRDRNA2_/TRDRNA2_153232_c0_seq1.p1 gnl/TRDRNA2_/TRDRNA2_153232_c0~~gnl/TRDRNA2_/TRDRNA2_153232_c0_seq1.p1  ORF type:complete len:191 (-),score=37.91 gnl/TRDRNA2_/TRDRNA2_153232_c0_seq1:277-849(-)
MIDSWPGEDVESFFRYYSRGKDIMKVWQLKEANDALRAAGKGELVGAKIRQRDRDSKGMLSDEAFKAYLLLQPVALLRAVEEEGRKLKDEPYPEESRPPLHPARGRGGSRGRFQGPDEAEYDRMKRRIAGVERNLGMAKDCDQDEDNDVEKAKDLIQDLADVINDILQHARQLKKRKGYGILNAKDFVRQ